MLHNNTNNYYTAEAHEKHQPPLRLDYFRTDLGRQNPFITF